MLHVLFILLKIIGMILALLLCLLVIFLAVPIRYSFQMEKKDAAPFWGRIKVTWLFSILYLKASYIDKVFDYRVRIFGYQILGNQEEFLKKKEEKEQRKREKEKYKEEKERQKREKEKQKEEKKKGEDELKAASLEAEKSLVALPENFAEDESLKESVDFSYTEESADERKTEEKASPDVEEEKKTNSSRDCKEKEAPKTNHNTKEKNKDSGFAGKKKKAKSFLESLKSKAVTLRENISMVKNLYEEYHGQELIALAKKSIIKLLRHVLPVRLKGLIRFGFDDPATTGLVTGLAAIFYPKYHKSFSLDPDFQTACFETECKGRGRIRIGYFLYMGIYILLNKDIRRVIKLVINK